MSLSFGICAWLYLTFASAVFNEPNALESVMGIIKKTANSDYLTKSYFYKKVV